MIQRATLNAGLLRIGRVRRLAAAALGLFLLTGCGTRSDDPSESSKPNATQEAESLPKPAVSDGATSNPEPIKPRSADDPVSVRLVLNKDQIAAGEDLQLTVGFSVAAGFEIQSLDASLPKVPTQLSLQLPEGFEAEGDWNVPATVRSFNPGGDAVYLGEVEFVQRIHVADDLQPGPYQIACRVSYQACDSRRCLRPVEALLSVELRVGR